MMLSYDSLENRYRQYEFTSVRQRVSISGADLLDTPK
jgi:hypothetical protein